MNKSEFYSDFLFRYQTEAAPKKMSIDSFCLREGVEYSSFIRWYRENKKRLRENEMKEIRLSPIMVTHQLTETVVSLSDTPPVDNVIHFHLKLDNGIEIHKEHTNLCSITMLLQSLSKLC